MVVQTNDSFLYNERLLTPAQYGFRPKTSCSHAILSITEFMRLAIEKKDTGQAFFVNLKKGFDTLYHKTLMRKNEKYGYRGTIHSLIKSYLQHRWLYVSVELVPITGVPHGSVLGPFLNF